MPSNFHAEDESEDEYVPPPPPVTKAKARTSKAQPKPTARVSHVAIDDVNNGDDDAGDDSVLIIPNKKARQAAIAGLGPDAEYIPRPGEVDHVKKKKRCATGSALLRIELVGLTGEQATWQEAGHDWRPNRANRRAAGEGAREGENREKDDS